MDRIKKLLLVEDDKNERFFFEMVLHDMNPAIELVQYKSCTEALEGLRTMEVLPDFIFLDSHLPGMNGMECLNVLKHDAKLMHIPVIIYSGSEDPGDADLFIQKGALYFLTKRNNYDELPGALREAIRGARNKMEQEG
jgi:DNA-binding NtrC family response regulator